MAIRRIVVTGGPGGGKTTLWRALVEAHPSRVLPVPEVATMMFRHVFPQVRGVFERESVQRAIYEVQCSLEAVQEGRRGSKQALLCDRGTPDGGGYWPDGHEAFFRAMRSDWQVELGRYDAVLFLETAAAGGLSIAEGNEVRTEDLATAMAIDRRLFEVWSPHPRFVHVGCNVDFSAKIALAAGTLSAWLGELEEAERDGDA